MTAALEKDAKEKRVKELKAKALAKLPLKPPVSHLVGISSNNKGLKKKAVAIKKKVPVKKAPIKKAIKPVAPIKKKAVISK
jgi:hypothetical protein